MSRSGGGDRPRSGRALSFVVGTVLAAVLVAAMALPTLLREDVEGYAWVSSWGGSGSGPGEFSGPIGVAVDDSGYVYVSDSGNDRIQKFTTDGAFVAEWGAPGEGPGHLRRPMHLTIDGEGVLRVAEYLNDRVQSFRPDGTLAGIVDEEPGTPGGELDAPGGAAVSASGEDLWIADFFHHRVAIFGRTGGYRRSVGTGGRLLPGRLHYPTDVAVGPDGSVYVADAYNHRVQRFTEAGRPVDRWGGPLGLGVPGPWKGWFNVATGVHVDAEGRLFTADFYNHRVQLFDASGRYIAELGGAGDEDGRFDRPTDVATGPDGSVYVVDFGHDRVQRFHCATCGRR